jgi:hypothetical protein
MTSRTAFVRWAKMDSQFDLTCLGFRTIATVINESEVATAERLHKCILEEVTLHDDAEHLRCVPESM